MHPQDRRKHVHGAVVVFVGGDWMPFGRFFVPMVPSLVVLGTACMMHAGDGTDGGPATSGRRVSALVRTALAAVLVLASQFGAGRGGRHVLAEVFLQVREDRAHLLELDARVEEALDDLELQEVAVGVLAPAPAARGIGEGRAHEVGARPVVELPVRDPHDLGGSTP